MWFHVVTDGAIGSVTQAQIDAQMTVLNLAFAGFYGGAKSGFRFELAGVTRTDNADWFYGGITGSGERPMKRALHRGGFETLNVYSTTAARTWAGPTCRACPTRTSTWTGSSSTGSRWSGRRTRMRGGTTSG